MLAAGRCIGSIDDKSSLSSVGAFASLDVRFCRSRLMSSILFGCSPVGTGIAPSAWRHAASVSSSAAPTAIPAYRRVIGLIDFISLPVTTR
jgi:hypothetical protein